MLPLQNPRARGGSLRLGDVAGLLQGDREAGVRQRILRREHGESQRDGHRGFKLARFPKRPDQTVMGLDMPGVRGNRRPKSPRRATSISRRQQFHSALRKLVGREENWLG